MKFTGKIDYSEVKLIIADMDGTICDDQRKISDYTIEVIKKCQAKGIGFGLASGRDTESLKEFEEKLGMYERFSAISELLKEVKPLAKDKALVKKIEEIEKHL